MLVGLAPRMNVVRLSIVSLALVVAWLAVIPSVRRRYRRALEATLGAHGAVEDAEIVVGAEEHAAVLGLLERAEPRTARVALEMIEGRVPAELRARVEHLAAHAPAELRAEALRALPRIEGASFEPALAALAEPSAEVRAAAATAAATLLGDEAAARLAPLFDDPEPHVRTAALAGVLGRCGIEGALVGGDRLGRMLRAKKPAERAEAARVLGALGPGAYAPLRSLLDDPDPAVRLAALRAAADVADRRLVPLLLDALGAAHTRDRAARALVAIGTPAAAPLVGLLGDPATPRALRLSLPRIVRRIPAREGYEALSAMLGTDDDHLRLRILAALGQLRDELGLPPEPPARVEELVRRELRDGYGLLAAWQQARGPYDRPLLAAMVTRRHRGTVRRLTRVLELRYDRSSLSLVRYALDSPARRANALEVLDALLAPSLRAVVLPFLDERAPAEMLAQAGDLVGPTPEPEAFLLAECNHPNPWTVAVALEALASRPSAAGLDVAETLASHADPLVREQALVTAAAVDLPRARREAERLVDDLDPIVARRARFLAETPTPETTMRSTLEKVLLLKAAAIFRELSTEDLAPLARVSDEETHAAGTCVFAEGEIGDSLYVILRGKVRVTHGGHELAVLGAGDAFGEMAVLDTAPRSATVETLENTELLAIGSEEFYDVLREQGELAEAVIKMLSARLREANEALEGRPSTEVA